MRGWGLETLTSSLILALSQLGVFCVLTLHKIGVMGGTYFKQH